jgi:hypothetical protein
MGRSQLEFTEKDGDTGESEWNSVYLIYSEGSTMEHSRVFSNLAIYKTYWITFTVHLHNQVTFYN